VRGSGPGRGRGHLVGVLRGLRGGSHRLWGIGGLFTLKAFPPCREKGPGTPHQGNLTTETALPMRAHGPPALLQGCGVCLYL
jgi:hypothetical protein